MCGMCAHVCICVCNALIHLCTCIPRSEEAVGRYSYNILRLGF